MYQLGSLFIFGQKLISVYVRGCIKNVLLSISKNTNGCWGMFFPTARVFLQQIHIDFDIKGL